MRQTPYDYIMITQPGYTPKKHLGTIVIDGCVMMDLGADIPQELREQGGHSIRHLYEILPTLAQEGYHIVIPSLALYNGGGLLDNGICIDNYFDHHAEENYYPRPVDLVRFLQTVIKDQKRDPEHRIYRNIDIIPTTKPEEAARFLAGAKEIVQNFGNRHDIIAKKICHLQRISDKVLSDNSINALLSDMQEESGKGTLYLLSNRTPLLVSNSRACPRLHLLNINGLINALVESGMHRRFGLQPDITSAALINSIHEQVTANLTRKRHAAPRRDAIDCTQMAESPLNLCGTKHHPFLNVMKTLAREAGVNDAPPVPSPRKSSASERFRMKYALGTDGKYHPRVNDNGAHVTGSNGEHSR